MKRSLHIYLILIVTFCCSKAIYAQQISVNSNVTIQRLIEDNLVNGCVEISNVTSSVNGSASGFTSYGEFNRSTSNFPFENGIMLATGSATSGGNGVNTNVLSEGVSGWGTDLDLENALGITSTMNATSIEFDLISIYDQVNFNYIFASEEYFGVFPCQRADGFAFLIKETGSAAPYQNIALVPGASTPVNTSTIRNEVVGLNNCPAQNDQYFDGFNLGDTNYNGRTTVLTASAPITAYVQYHIKLVIADQGDRTYDSAVFIEGDSFKVLDLGDDITTCANSVTLDATVNNPTSTYEWFFDNSATPIPGQTNATLDATQTGLYRVEITNQLNSSSCIEEDEVMITLSSEESIDTIDNYFLCDDLSGNEIETFNVFTKDTELDAVIPFTNYSRSYHYSDAEARSDSNAITSNAIQNTINPQPIFVRIEDTDSGCFAYTSFDLIVNVIPNIIDPTDLNECDADTQPDGRTNINLTQKNDEITSGASNYIVSYHYNNLDANNGNNPIPSPDSYTNTNPTDNLFVRIVDSNTGCFNTSTLNVNITTSPVVNRDTQFLDACDQDDDGTDIFDLTSAIADILDGLAQSSVTVTFHESYDEANTDTNPISNANTYQNIQPDQQLIFVRVEDNITGCATITFLEIHTNLLTTGTDTGDFALCDDESGDGIINFNLNVIEVFIANNLPNITVGFFESQTDLDNNNALPHNVLYPVDGATTLLVNIDNGACSEVGEIRLLVNPILQFPVISSQEYCDNDDNPDDGIVSVNMNTFNDLITGGNTDFGVRYYPSDIDAQNNTNQLQPFHQINTSQEIFTRIEHNDTNCTSYGSFEITITIAPTIASPTPFLICDNDNNGISIVNLEDKISEITSTPSLYSIDFFTNSNDAETNTNPIPLTERVTYSTSTQTIFVRVENTTSNCYDIATLEIIVNTLPIISTIEDFSLCEDDGDNRTEFLFSDKDADILNGQPEKEVLYFTDAAFTLPIDKTVLYTNTSSPQTIYVRVQNITDPNCFEPASFTIRVEANPVYTAPNDFFECDDPSNDERSTFNLSEKIDEINQSGAQNNTITFHLNFQDAEDNINPQGIQFNNTINPQQLYARIQNNNSECFQIEGFGINVIAAPDLSAAENFILCDTDYDNEAIFNLENADYINNDRITTGVEVRYFENANDTDNNSLSITTPTVYQSPTKTVYIKITNTFTTCSTVIPLELIVNPTPTINNLGTIPICDNDTDTFDLFLVNDMIVDDTSIVNISYHNTATDATDNLNPITQNIFNYTLSTHDFHIRIENISTGCVITNPFTLQINQNPIIGTPQDLRNCNDNFDDFLEFDLTQNDGNILNGLSPLNYNIYYYNEYVTNAETDTNRLPNNHFAVNGEIIYVRLENNSTGCFDVEQFTITIDPLPIIPLEDIEPLCIDGLPMTVSAETGNVGDTYEWDDGRRTPEVLFDIPDLGDHWVEVTTINNCTYRKDFTLRQSEEANINFTTTVNFVDPNSITVDVGGIGNYVYILDENLGGQPQTSNIFEDVSFGRHIVTVRDLNGCTDANQAITVFDIPKFITPNNDTFFDTWHIIGIDELPGTIVHIFNRHGKLLKSLPHTSIGWDGTFNGQNMPSDDYWYSADVIENGNTYNLKGHFTLKR